MLFLEAFSPLSFSFGVSVFFPQLCFALPITAIKMSAIREVGKESGGEEGGEEKERREQGGFDENMLYLHAESSQTIPRYTHKKPSQDNATVGTVCKTVYSQEGKLLKA